MAGYIWDFTAGSPFSYPGDATFLGTLSVGGALSGSTALFTGNVSTSGTLSGNVSVPGATSSIAISSALTVEPEYFGAVGNGIADDTAAINSALNSSAQIVFLKGIYNVNSSNIVVPAGKILKSVYVPGVPTLLNFQAQPGTILLNPTYSIILQTGSAIKNALVMNSTVNVSMASGSYNTSMYRANLNLISYMNTTAAGKGIILDNTNDPSVTDCMVLGFNLGISMYNCARPYIDNVLIDSNTGWQLQQSYDTGFLNRVRVHAFLTWGGFPPLVYDITAVASNGGLTELTLAQDASNTLQPFAFQNGDWINVTGVTGMTTPINQLWYVQSVNATNSTVTLTGSAYSTGAVLTNAKVVVNPYKRFGTGAVIQGITGVTLNAPWVFGHDTGFHIGDYTTGGTFPSAWVSVSKFGCDNLNSTNDPNTVGLLIDGGTEWLNMSVGTFSSQGTAIVHNSTATDVNTFSNCMIANNTSGSSIVNMLSGSAIITASKINSGGSYINVGTAVTRLILSANDGRGTNIIYANSAVKSNVYVDPIQQFNSGQYAFLAIDASGNTNFTIVDSTYNTWWKLAASPNGSFGLTNLDKGTVPFFVNTAGFTVTELLYANAGINVNGTNAMELFGNTTGNSPYIQAVGADANVSLGLLTKGTGTINFGGGVTGSTADFSGAVTIGGAASIAGAISASSITAANETVTGALSVGGASSFANVTTSNATVSGGLDVTGVITGTSAQFTGSVVSQNILIDYSTISATTTLTASQSGQYILANSATPITITLPVSTSFAVGGGVFEIENIGAGQVTIALTTADTVNPVFGSVLNQNDYVKIYSNSTLPGWAISGTNVYNQARIGNATVSGALSGGTADFSGNVTIGGSIVASGTITSSEQVISGGTLGDVAGDTYIPWVASLYDTNDDQIRLTYTRLANPDNGWLTTSRVLQHIVDVTPKGYFEFSPAANVSGIDIGSGSTPNVRVPSSGPVQLLQGATLGGALSGTTANFSGAISSGGTASVAALNSSGAATIGGALGVSGNVTGIDGLYSGYVHAQNVLYGQTVYSSGPVTLTAAQSGSYIFTTNTAPMNLALPLSTDFTQVGAGMFFIQNDGSANLTITLSAGDTNNNIPNGGVLTPGMSVLVGNNPGILGWDLITTNLLPSVQVTGNANIGGAVTIGGAANVTGAISSSGLSAGGTIFGFYNSNGVIPTSPYGAGFGVVWNYTSGGGDTDFIAYQGSGGFGGFRFYNQPSVGGALYLGGYDGLGNLTAVGSISGNSLAITGAATAASMIANVSNSTVQPSTSLTTLRSLAVMADDLLTIDDFGADPTGNADSTTPILNAIASGKTVIIGPGRYKTTAPIPVPATQSIIGTGPLSIIAPAFAGWAFTQTNSTQTFMNSAFMNFQIMPTVAGAGGIQAVAAVQIAIRNVTFTGCSLGSIYFDRVQNYKIEACFVTASAFAMGGSIISTSTVISGTGAAFSGPGSIWANDFGNNVTSPYGNASPCIKVQNSPNVSVISNSLWWGAWGASPIDFIHVEDQCQGNIIDSNKGLGVSSGILVRPTATFNIMPSYIQVTNNVIDSFGSNGIAFLGTSGSSEYNNIRNNQVTEPQQEASSIALVSGGTGFAANAIIAGPAVAATDEGSPVYIKVLTVDANGVILTASLYNSGLTQSPPANPVTFTDTGGHTATFNLTFSPLASCITVQYLNKADISDNDMQNYSGGIAGTGINAISLTNSIVSKNKFDSLTNWIYFNDALSSNVNYYGNVLTNVTNVAPQGTVPTAKYATYQAWDGPLYIGTTININANPGEIVGALLYASTSVTAVGSGLYTNDISAVTSGGTVSFQSAVAATQLVTASAGIDVSSIGGISTNPVTITSPLQLDGGLTGSPVNENSTLPATIVSGTWYQNTTGGPIWLSIPIEFGPSSGATLYTNSTQAVGGVSMDEYTASTAETVVRTMKAIIPNNWYWILTTNGTTTIVPANYYAGALRLV